MDELSGLDGGRIGLVGLDRSDRDQWQAYVAHFLEQAIQRGLVDHRAMDDGGAVAFVGEAQSVKPGGPSGIEVPLEADFVPVWVVMRAGRYFAHCPPFSCRLAGWISAGVSDVRRLIER